MRALARSDSSAAKVAALGAEPVHGRPRRRRRACAPAPRAASTPSTRPPTSASGARARSSSATTSAARATRSRRAARAGRAALRPRRHRGGAARGRAARERERGRTAAARLEGALPGHQGDGRAGGARRERRRLRDRRRPAAARLGSRRHHDRAVASTAAIEKGRFAWIGGGGHLTVHDPRRQHRRGPGARRDARAGPGGVYFVTDGEPVVFREFITELLARHRASSRPDRNTPAPVARVAADGRRGDLEGLRLKGSAAGHPPRLLALGAGVHDRHLAGRAELGYEPVRTREDGLEELRQATGLETAGPCAYHHERAVCEAPMGESSGDRAVRERRALAVPVAARPRPLAERLAKALPPARVAGLPAQLAPSRARSTRRAARSPAASCTRPPTSRADEPRHAHRLLRAERLGVRPAAIAQRRRARRRRRCRCRAAALDRRDGRRGRVVHVDEREHARAPADDREAAPAHLAGVVAVRRRRTIPGP